MCVCREGVKRERKKKRESGRLSEIVSREEGGERERERQTKCVRVEIVN